MVSSMNVEKLRRVSKEYDRFIHKLNKRGKSNVAYKLAKRQSTYDAIIEEIK